MENECTQLMNEKLNKDSAEPDEVPAFLIKKYYWFVGKPFVFLINLSFCLAKFPNKLKVGNVILIYKRKSKQHMEFEHCFLNRILRPLDPTDKMSSTQHGFRSGQSTTTAIHAMCEALADSIETGTLLGYFVISADI